MSQLTEPVLDKSKPPAKTLNLVPKEAVELLLSVLGNRAIAFQKLNNHGKAYEDASLGVRIYESHQAKMGGFKMPRAKFHYRRMLSLEGLLGQAESQIRNCSNELLKIEMLENVVLYHLELKESCSIVNSTEGNTISGRKARALETRFDWIHKEYSLLQKKKKENEELSKKIKRSMTEIPISKEPPAKSNMEAQDSIEQIAKKAMESLLESETLATSASDFQIKVESFKNNLDFVARYIFKYSPEDFQKLYSKRELEASFMLKIIAALDTLSGEEDLKRVGRILEVIMQLPKSQLTFRMMIKSEKRRLRRLLEKVDQVRESALLPEYKKRFKLPDN